MRRRESGWILFGDSTAQVDSYLRTIMKLSDSLYYGVIKNEDLDQGTVNSRITLLYDNNKDNIANIALLSKEGELLEAVPAARLKTGLDVTKERIPFLRILYGNYGRTVISDFILTAL